MKNCSKKDLRTDHEILSDIESIAPNNSFISYIVDRVQDDNYRGIQCSQHNRLSYKYFKTLIEIIYQIAGDNAFGIHVGDDKKEKQPNASLYYLVVKLIKQTTGKGTINSVKKNTFPDLARGGFLYRYDRQGNIISEAFSLGEYKNSKKTPSVPQVQLSPLAIKFITTKYEFERRLYFTEFVDRLTKNTATDLVDMLSTDESFDSINELEFMYILSDDRTKVRYNDKMEYLSAYRSLSPEKQEKVTSLLKEYCDPERNVGNKTNARDYGNWKNETQQIFGLLSYSTIFKVVDGQLLLNDGDLGVFTNKAERSQKPKTEYFKYHEIDKHSGYELHHIIPFKKANNKQDAKMIDDERNLIYLSSEKHAEFTTTQNVNIRTSYTNPNILFLQLDNADNFIIVDISKGDALVSKDKIQEMIEYNRRLLKKFYGVG